jgi:sporulation protein YlmC with PRC-barrel domain
MNTVRYLSLMAALGLAGAVQAQTQTPPDPVQTDPTQTTQQPSTSPTEGTAADRTPPGHTPTQQEPGQTTTPGQTSPSPSTSPTEGTAADRTPPGQTPTQSTPSTGTTETSPMPSTSQSEGTAADRSPPGQTSTQGETGMTSDTTRMAAAGGMSGMRGSKIIGKNVQTTTGDSLGDVEDVIVDRDGRVTHAVVSHGGRLTAVPWTVLSRSMQGDRLVMERSSLERAPSFEKGQWPNLMSNTWSSDVDSYWSARGGSPLMRE